MPFLPPFTADPASHLPQYRQIHDFLRQAILNGALPPGARLPSTRALAKSLGASRNTVLSAYETLASEGLIRSRTGSGTRVTGKRRPNQPLDVRLLLRASHYPADSMPLLDADGNPLYIHR